MEKEELVLWLREGEEFRAADLIEQCELELVFVDSVFPLNNGPDIDIYDLNVRCQRKLLDRLYDEFTEEVKQVESAVGQLAETEYCHVRQIRWLALVGVVQKRSTEIGPVEAETLLSKLAKIKQLMIAFVTGSREDGQPRAYHDLYLDADALIDKYGLDNPNPHTALDSFWEFCKSEGLATYSSRRAYVENLFSDITLLLGKKRREAKDPRFWKRVEGGIQDELSPVRSQWKKARNYLLSENPDFENAAKEAINSLESAVKIYARDDVSTLGQLVKKLPIDHDISRLISAAYGVLSNKPSVRHGGTRSSGLEKEEALFFLEFSAVAIEYLKSKCRTKNPA